MDKKTYSDTLVAYRQSASYLYRVAAELTDAPNTSLRMHDVKLRVAARHMTTLIQLVNRLIEERENSNKGQ